MRELRRQLISALLAIVTVAVVIGAATNFQQQSRFHLADDGVTWVNRVHDGRGWPTAIYVVEGSPGAKAGIRVGDELVAVGGLHVSDGLDVPQVLARIGSWKKTDYELRRNGRPLPATVIVGETERDPTLYYQYAVGVLYLAIGLFVYIRRRTAPRSVHFFLLCLVSFVQSTFHYTGKLNPFDKVVYLGNVIAGFLAPALFLHFCCVFPEPQRWIRKKFAAWLVYAPGVALAALQIGVSQGWLTTSEPLLEVRWLLDRMWLFVLCAMYIGGAAVLSWQRKQADDPIVRRQLTWLRNGAICGIVPFTAIYAIPYILGVPPTQAMSLAVLSLPLIPVMWAYAILRYRLMDVDVIFQEGYVYTLATFCVLGVFYGLIFAVSRAGDPSAPAMIAMILVAAFVFQPIRKWIQEQLDRYYFYKDRYDYRRTLIEFARELGASTDLVGMLDSVSERLIKTLGVRHLAFFQADDRTGQFRLIHASNQSGRKTESAPADLDLSFLAQAPTKPYLFFERTRNPIDVVSGEWPASVRRTIADLELTYYIPCAARGRTIAYMGVSRTESGDFLPSEDVELLTTLSGYVGIAFDNINLYRSLADKAGEYERLKEFSENIVESINVGIMAVDWHGAVESWNTRMERLTGILRSDAVGRTLAELFPSDLCEEIETRREDQAVSNIYKYPLRSREATLNIAIAPLVSKAGERVGRLIIFDDVTDREELEKRLVQADKLSSIGLLAAGVAHEVNTPLAVISTYAQILAKQIADDAQKAPIVEKITRQTFRASEIVNSLLNFSRTGATEQAALDLNRVVKETLALLEHQLDKSGVRVETDLAASLPRVRGAGGKLQQVFLNLFLNARDAMEEGGALMISTTAFAGNVRVVVADTGTGISPDNLPRIFDPFFTTKGARKGTGLGLSVSYGIVREHGGDIEVESSVGRGTRFVLTFPEHVPAREAAQSNTIVEARLGAEPVAAVSSAEATI